LYSSIKQILFLHIYPTTQLKILTSFAQDFATSWTWGKRYFTDNYIEPKIYPKLESTSIFFSLDWILVFNHKMKFAFLSSSLFKVFMSASSYLHCFAFMFLCCYIDINCCFRACIDSSVETPRDSWTIAQYILDSSCIASSNVCDWKIMLLCLRVEKTFQE
jgi:hypothetical protein